MKYSARHPHHAQTCKSRNTRFLSFCSLMVMAYTSAYAPQAFAQQSDSAADNVRENTDNDHIEDGVNGDDNIIIVTGRAAQLYRAEKVDGSKLSVAPLDNSQVTTIITDELIEDQGARTVRDLYRNISGVTTFSYAGVTARGFRQEENFYDGLRGDPYAGFSVPQTFNIERVEFLKGPTGMLYGPSAPGGIFHFVTKKPEQEFFGHVRGVIGNYARHGGEFEVNTPIGENFAARAGVFYENRHPHRNNTGDESLIIDAGAKAFLPDNGHVTLQYTRYEQNLRGNRLRGVPTDDDGYFLTSIDWNHNERSDFLNLDSAVIQGTMEINPLDWLSINGAIRYNKSTEKQQYHEPRGLFDSDNDGIVDSSIREFRDQQRFNESWSHAFNAIASHKLSGLISNRLLLGYDQYWNRFHLLYNRARGKNTITPGLPTPLSLFDPEYGVTDPSSYHLQVINNPVRHSERRGFYLMEELTIGPVILSGGIRFDQFDDRSGDVEYSDHDQSYRSGIIVKATDDISLFGQYATSFEPQSAASQDPRAGGPFDPVTGDIWEGGIKTALMNGRIQSSISAYRIKKQNILQSDPRGDVNNDGIDDQVAFGEVTSKGVEVEITADITPNWVASVAYAYNDTRITENIGSNGIRNQVGDRFANAPENQLGFWTRYQIPDIGIAFAFGGDYVSSRQSISGQKVRPYMTFDASLIYETGPWKALLRADNLFDKTYAASGFISRTGHFPGEPFGVFFELSYNFQ